MQKVTHAKNERIGNALAGVEFFAATVAAGSFAAGAKALGVTASAVSRRVAALEEELGVQLLARTTRTLRLTSDGAAFYDRCARILEEVREARDAFARVKRTPAGLLRVEVPLSLGRFVIAPALPRFLAQHPQVRVDLTLRDQVVDPVVEGMDLCLRIGELSDSSLIAKKLGESRIVHCASPSYLKRHSAPRSPPDLARHARLGYLREGRAMPFFLGESAELRPFAVSGPVNVNDSSVLLGLVIAGQGIGAFFDFMAKPALARGELEMVLEDFASIAQPIHVLYPPNRHLLPKVRVFIEFLSALFAGKAGRSRS
jgi:LysR family transcriptional regulator for bpeEF and oprC